MFYLNETEDCKILKRLKNAIHAAEIIVYSFSNKGVIDVSTLDLMF